MTTNRIEKSLELKRIIEKRIESIRNDYYKTHREMLCATIGSQEDIKLTNKYYELSGKIEAYEDILKILREE